MNKTVVSIYLFISLIFSKTKKQLNYWIPIRVPFWNYNSSQLHQSWCAILEWCFHNKSIWTILVAINILNPNYFQLANKNRNNKSIIPLLQTTSTKIHISNFFLLWHSVIKKKYPPCQTIRSTWTRGYHRRQYSRGGNQTFPLW